MKEFKNGFKPEISPIHKRLFSIACVLKLEDGELTTALATGYIPAGKLLTTKSDDLGDTILSNPNKGVSITVADEKAQGVLMHDVEVEAGVKEYSVGVLVSGVVYEDVVKKANGVATSKANKEALQKNNILFYEVETLKGVN